MRHRLSWETFHMLKVHEFRNLMIGRFFIILAFKMTSTLLGWWVYDLTNSPFAIGVIGLVEVVPAISCALYAGHFIDMNEKRRLLLMCNFAYIILLGFLLIPAWFQVSLGISNEKLTYLIYLIVFFTGISRAFLGPIVPAMIPKIINKELLSNAISVNQTTFLSASVLGHIIGGFLVSGIEVKGTLIVVVLLLFMAFIFYFKVKPQPSDFTHDKPRALDSIKEGLNYIFKTKEIIGALTLDLFAVLFGGAVALIPVFARDILQVGAKGFGLLNAATDIGATIIILTLSFFPLRRNQGKILIISVFGFGFCILLFGVSKLFILSFMALLCSGILDGVSMIIRGTIVQLKTPDSMRGRVMSVNSMFVMSSNELGQFESGVMARFVGAANAVIIGGGVTMSIALLVGYFSPKLREMEY